MTIGLASEIARDLRSREMHREKVQVLNASAASSASHAIYQWGQIGDRGWDDHREPLASLVLRRNFAFRELGQLIGAPVRNSCLQNLPMCGKDAGPMIFRGGLSSC